MPLLNTLGKPLTAQDLHALKVMLRGSLDNHILKIEDGKNYAQGSGVDTGLYDEIALKYTL